MLKLLIAFCLLMSESLFAADLKKLDGQYSGSMCTNLELYVYYVARGSRDEKNEDVKYTKQRIEATLEEAIKNKLHEFIDAKPDYFINIRDYLFVLTDEIWTLKAVSPGMLADIMRVNCQNPYFYQDTDNFYSLTTIGKMRGWIK